MVDFLQGVIQKLQQVQYNKLIMLLYSSYAEADHP